MARKKGPQVDDAYEYIKNKIMTFEFAPGSDISDYKLEQQLEMSRSPIREAIMRLSSDGLIEVANNKTIVAPMTLKDIVEICQVRKAIEIAAIEILFENSGPGQPLLDSLLERMESMKRAGDLAKNYALDDQFHSLLLEAAANSRIMDIGNKMRLQISRARWLNIFMPSRLGYANSEHAEIYDALAARDMERAKAAMGKHLDNSTESFEAVLSNPSMRSQLLMGIAAMVNE